MTGGRLRPWPSWPRAPAPAPAGGVTPAQLTAAAVPGRAGEFDPVHAGFGQAPKFPPSMVLEFLLRHYERTGDAEAVQLADRTLEAMARGGMYAQLGGGV